MSDARSIELIDRLHWQTPFPRVIGREIALPRASVDQFIDPFFYYPWKSGALVVCPLPRRRLSRRTVETFCKSHEHECAYCGWDCGPLTIDHIVPVRFGGSDAQSNLRPACHECNSSAFQRVYRRVPWFGPAVLHDGVWSLDGRVWWGADHG